ncbi:MAG: chromosomal replication initiator protein DnaA [Acidimicrobiales bacterium]
MGDAEALWTRCTEIVRPEVSDSVWQSTFNMVSPLDLRDGQLVLGVPSAIQRERLEGRYQGLLLNALRESGALGISIVVEVVTAPSTPACDTDAEAETRSASPQAERVDRVAQAASAAPGSMPRAAPPAAGPRDGPPENLNQKYTFDAFVTGASNRFAHAAALSVAETPGRSYNPLFIYGDAGLGKTHLLQAIAFYVRENYPYYKVKYVSTETFLNQFVDAIRSNTSQLFKQRYREIDVLLVDDIQFMEGKEGLQEEFFHTFNHLHEASRQVVLSSDRPPDSISTLEDRLRSRFKMGLITDIQPPDLETRLAILRKKAEQEPSVIPNPVFEFIAGNITNNIRELEGALIRVCAYASLNQTQLTVELAERVLTDILLNNRPRVITPRLILDETSAMFGFSLEEICGKSRRRPLVTSRQVAMYVMRELTELSYPAIAREFGGRDHTTVIHAVEKIGALMKERRPIYDQVTELIARIKSGGGR